MQVTPGGNCVLPDKPAVARVVGWGFSPRHPGGTISPHNVLNVGDRSLQGFDSLFGHLRALQMDFAELGEAVEMLQAGVADCCVAQVEALELGQPFEMNQIGVGKRGVLEIERFEFRQTLEARAADFRAINPELDKLGQALEVNQAGVRDRYVVKRQVFQLGHVFEVNQSGIGNRTTTQIESVDQGMFLED